ncbi:MAG: hypothetical protein E6G56_13830 [Actinobacteria bacterium]|nr:MAG: hypothetical protein E6G56_13830 [Actinomycetota bacterium]
MLFDLRGRGRRRTIQAIYLLLAILMGGGLVFFGIGGNTSGGLLDAFKGGGGSSSNGFDSRVKAAEQQATRTPNNPAVWAQLAHLRFQLAGTGDNYSQTQGTFTPKGRSELGQVKTAWDRYLALNPPRPDANLANEMLQALGGQGALGDYAGAARAAEIVSAARPSYAVYAQLAAFSYLAGQSRKGDLASAKAVSLAPSAQRSSLKQQLDQAKKQGTSGASAANQPTG